MQATAAAKKAPKKTTNAPNVRAATAAKRAECPCAEHR